jgi:hypothetical protein
MMIRSLVVASMLAFSSSSLLAQSSDWKSDPIWHDGLVEKATYAASRVIYGKPRSYEAVFFTNKEQHDTKTWTKSDKSTTTVEVFKHNQVEVIPTPNYDYKFVTTSHLTVDGLKLTRLDMSSQEFCGTSFRQYQLTGESLASSFSYFGYSYFPEQGRVQKTVSQPSGTPVVAYNGLPVWLRSYDFAGKPTVSFLMLPDQKNNRATPADPVKAEVRYLGEDEAGHKLQVSANTMGDGLVKMAPTATIWFAKDRQHVMTKFQSADGNQTYELKGQERVNYWTIKGE